MLNRLHKQNVYTVIFRSIGSFKSFSIWSIHFPFVFSISFNITTVSSLFIPPGLFHLLTWPLISCFLLSILTQDWCALVRRCLLKNWQSAWLGTDFSVLRLFCTHPAQGKVTDRLFVCLPSQIRSRLFLTCYFIQSFDWKPTHDVSLPVMWHLKYAKTCQDQWTLCVNIGHPCLMSNDKSWHVGAEYEHNFSLNYLLTVFLIICVITSFAFHKTEISQ